MSSAFAGISFAQLLMVAIVGVVLIAGDEGPGGVVRRKKKRAIKREPILKKERAIR